MIPLLPHWALTNKHPAFYDNESGSVIEHTAKMYAKVNELVVEYNSFVENVNTIIKDFTTTTTKDLEAFEVALRQEFQDFIDTVNLHIMSQDKDIEDAVNYMKNNITATTKTVVNQALKDGTISIALDYDAENESIEIVGGV
ncbi:MAG: hypothetical protein J6U90_04975 [Methanobrevibacter sp.]|nr:hypothetical protein [Methanobrevibacter sp.]